MTDPKQTSKKMADLTPREKRDRDRKILAQLFNSPTREFPKKTITFSNPVSKNNGDF